MQIQKWLGLFGLLLLPFLMIGCGVTVANETYVRVGFIDAGGTQIELALDNPDATQGIVFKVVPANATVRNVTFESKNTSVATVDNLGNVKPVGVGTTIVTITSVADSNVTADVKVRVVAKRVTLSPPTGLRFDRDATELIWDPVQLEQGSYYKPSYQLSIEATDLNSGSTNVGTTTPTTFNTKYSNFEPDRLYKVKVKTVGNGTSYQDSSYTSEYKFVILSDPNPVELVRLADFEGALTEEELTFLQNNHCQEGDTLNPDFKIRFPINPLILSELQASQDSDNPKSITDYYELVVANANNSQDNRLEKWEMAFSDACMRLCQIDGDNTWYGCFSVPNNITNFEYKVWVKVKSDVVLDNGCHVFSAGYGNLIRVTQLRSPSNLMARQNSTGDIQLSWDAVSHALGYVLEFRYVLDNGGGADINVSHRVEVINKTFITFNDIRQINPDAVISNFKSRDIYIYAKADNKPIGGVSYADSNFSTKQALEQLPAVDGLIYDRETGFVSWNRIEGDSLNNPICQYALYVSKSVGDESNIVITPEDIRVYNSTGGNGAQSIGNQIRYPIASSTVLQDGVNYLKIMAVPLDTGADPTKQKYSSSAVTASSKFLKLNSVTNVGFVAPTLENGERQLGKVTWEWSPRSDLADVINSLDVKFEVHFRVNGMDLIDRTDPENEKPIAMFVDYDSESEGNFGFELGGEDCPIKLDDDTLSQRLEIVVKVIAGPKPSVLMAINLIDSKDQGLEVERFAAPVVIGTRNGSLVAEVRYDAVVADAEDEGVQSILANVVGYEMLIEDSLNKDVVFFKNLANLSVKLDEYIQNYNSDLDNQIAQIAENESDPSVRESMINVLNERKLAKYLSIRLRAVALDENQDQFYLTQSKKNIYFVDGVWSARINVFKLDAPTQESISIQDGVLCWDNYDSSKEFGSKIRVGYQLNVTYASGDGEVTQSFWVEERSLLGSTTYELKSRIPYSTHDYFEYINAEDKTGLKVPPQATVRTILWEDDKTYNANDVAYYLISSGNSAPITVVQCDAIELDLNPETQSLCWNAVEGIQNFILKVKNNDTDEYEDTEIISEYDVLDAGNTISYNLSSWAQSEGSYTFYVYAQGNNELLNGVVSDGKVLVKLKSPTNLRVEDGLLQWDSVSYSTGSDAGLDRVKKYTIIVTKISDPDETTNKRLITVTNALSTSLDSLAEWIGNNRLAISIMSEGPEGATNIISSDKVQLRYSPGDMVVTDPKVFKWVDIGLSDITLDDVNNKLLWTYTNNLDGYGKYPVNYKVSITIPETIYNPAFSKTTMVTAGRNSATAELSLKEYTMFGHYVVRIQPLGYNDGNVLILNGTEGLSYTFERLPSTDSLSIVRDIEDTDPVIKWKKASYVLGDELVGDYNIIVRSQAANSSAVVTYKLANVLAKDLERINNGLGGLIEQDGNYYSITASNLRLLYQDNAVDFGPGEYAIYLQTVPRLVSNINLLSSALTRFTTLYIFGAPMISLDPESGDLEITKTFQKNNSVKLLFTPVTYSASTYGLGVPYSVNISFVGSTYVLDVHDVEDVLQNGDGADYLPTSNYVGFVLSTQAMGERNYVSSTLVSTGLFYKRIAPIEYRYQESGEIPNGWYVEEGKIRWNSVEGANRYYFRLGEDGEVVSVAAAYGSLVMSTMTSTGQVDLSVRVSGGIDRTGKISVGGQNYTKAYLASDYSTPRAIVKLTNPTNPRILTEGRYSGEFDFGERNALGEMQFMTGATAYTIQYYDPKNPVYDIAPWEIKESNKNDYFIASSEIYQTNDTSVKTFALKLYAIGNSPRDYSTMPYISSNGSSPFTIYIPGKKNELGFAYDAISKHKGNLKWNVISIDEVVLENGVNVELDYGTTSDFNNDTATRLSTSGSKPSLLLDKEGDIYYYSFEGIDDVKGNHVDVRIRYQGQNIGSEMVKTAGIVNSEWADSIRVYKLQDFEDNEIYNITTKLWSNVENGELNWLFSDATPSSLKNACIWFNDKPVEEKGNVQACVVETGDLEDNKVKVYIQNKKPGEYQYSKVLNSDVASQMFYQVNNIQSFYTYKDCRIGWELTNKDVLDEDNNVCVLQPTKLIVYYDKNNIAQDPHGINIKNEYTINTDGSFDMVASTGMWDVGMFSNIRAIAVGAVFDGDKNAVGMTLGSNPKLPENPTMNFNLFAGGAGLPSDPYLIRSDLSEPAAEQASLREQLKLVRYLNDMFFKLEDNIELLSQDGKGNNYGVPSGLSAEPEQFSQLVFTGGFDGNGNTISNIQSRAESDFGWWNKIVSTTWSNNYDASEPFFNLNGVVCNLTLEASLIDISSMEANHASGLLTKENHGYIINCKSTGSMGDCGNLYWTGFNKGDNPKMIFGGLVGIHETDRNLENGEEIFDGVIQDCVNELPISITFIGMNVQAYSVVGGIVGASRVGLIAGCENKARASITATYAGGIVGQVNGFAQDQANAYITGCVNSGNVTSQIYNENGTATQPGWHGMAGGIVAKCEYGFITASINSGLITHGTDWDGSDVRCIGGIVGDIVSTIVATSVHTYDDTLWVIGHDASTDLNTVFYCAWKNGVTDSDANGNKTLNNIANDDLKKDSLNTVAWGIKNLNGKQACVIKSTTTPYEFSISWID